MPALVKLWFYKQKAALRNLYRKPSSAIMTTLMILLYGFLFVMVLAQGSSQTIVNLVDMHMAILMSLGFGAMFVISLMLQKRKALFNVEDSFYLFSGPFSRKQVMRYLCAQTLLQAFFVFLIYYLYDALLWDGFAIYHTISHSFNGWQYGYVSILFDIYRLCIYSQYHQSGL